MKFALITALLSLLLALSKPASAAEWPSIEMRKSCPQLLRGTTKDGALAYYGCGKEDYASTDRKDEAGQPPEVGRQICGLETVGLTGAEMIKVLHETWSRRVNQEEFQKTYKYEGADILFRELRSALLKSRFPYESEWPYPDIDNDVREVIGSLGWTGFLHGKRYGKPVLELMVELSNRYPRNELFTEAQKYALNSMAFQSPAFRGPEEEKITAEERVFYAENLYDFYVSHPKSLTIHWLDPEKSLLNELAPDILQKLETLAASRQTQ